MAQAQGAAKSLFVQVVVATQEATVDYKPKVRVDYQLNSAEVSPHVFYFCFPDVEGTRAQGEEFVFVLTDSEGKRQYGFCKRGCFGDTLRSCICILTYYGWFELFTQLLHLLEAQVISALTQKSHSQEQWKTLTECLNSLNSQPLPEPGNKFQVKFAAEGLCLLEPHEFNQLQRPNPDDGGPVMGDNIVSFLISSLSVPNILMLFTAVLCERRIIMHASDVEKLASCIHAAAAILYPFSWQHIFVPAVPRCLLHYCEAPMPFMVGVLTQHMPLVRKLSLESVVFVDLDENVVTSTMDDASLLPKNPTNILRQTLEEAIRNDSRPMGVRHWLVIHAFREFFLSIFRTYRRFLVTSETGEYEGYKFDREGFISTQSRAVKKFLESFCQAQMFERFIAEKEMEANKNIPPNGFFEREVGMASAQVGAVGTAKDMLRSFIKKRSDGDKTERTSSTNPTPRKPGQTVERSNPASASGPAHNPVSGSTMNRRSTVSQEPPKPADSASSRSGAVSARDSTQAPIPAKPLPTAPSNRSASHPTPPAPSTSSTAIKKALPPTPKRPAGYGPPPVPSSPHGRVRAETENAKDTRKPEANFQNIHQKFSPTPPTPIATPTPTPTPAPTPAPTQPSTQTQETPAITTKPLPKPPPKPAYLYTSTFTITPKTPKPLPSTPKPASQTDRPAPPQKPVPPQPSIPSPEPQKQAPLTPSTPALTPTTDSTAQVTTFPRDATNMFMCGRKVPPGPTDPVLPLSPTTTTTTSPSPHVLAQQLPPTPSHQPSTFQMVPPPTNPFYSMTPTMQPTFVPQQPPQYVQYGMLHPPLIPTPAGPPIQQQHTPQPNPFDPFS